MKNLLLSLCAILLSISMIQAQETEAKKDNQSPDIYVDGKKFDFDMELIDQDKIESVFAVKDEKVIEKYNAPNGVIFIKTKKKISTDKSQIRIQGNSAKSVEQPMVIIDGKKSDKESLDKLSPDEIDNVHVLKGEKAIEKYNAPNGVIVIKTKKGGE